MKSVVIIGGNGGMGKATAILLAQKGYLIIIHGRDEKKTAEALNEIIAQSGNNNIQSVTGDLSTIAGMKKVAEAIQHRVESIDVLILAQGAILSKRKETVDGLESVFTVNYLSRFAIVNLLMPQLSKAKNPRIVQLGAPTMKKAKIHFDDLSLKNNFSMMSSMGQAMLANHLFTQEFAKRNKNGNIVMNILHVGIAKTEIGRETNFMFRLLIKLVGKAPFAAAGNIIYLADNDEANFSGYFLPKPGKPQVKQLIEFDAALAEKLWNESEKLISH